MPVSNSPDMFTIERHGEVTLILASPALERLEPSLIEAAIQLVLTPLREQETPLVVVDLSRVNYFGSTFLALLLRCWKLVTLKGGQMALSGVSPRARELLRITTLDMIWPLYANRQEAIDSLLSD